MRQLGRVRRERLDQQDRKRRRAAEVPRVRRTTRACMGHRCGVRSRLASLRPACQLSSVELAQQLAQLHLRTARPAWPRRAFAV